MKKSISFFSAVIVAAIWAGSALAAELDLSWSALLGGSRNDEGQAIAVDHKGYIYVAGQTESSDFPTTPGALHGALSSGENQSDVFIIKLAPTGSGLVYATFLGGSRPDQCADIALDASNNLCLTGTTYSSDFPVTAGAFDTSFGGGDGPAGDAFVTKINSLGTGLIYSTFLGGSQGDRARGIALDGSENIYLAGETQSEDFPLTAGAFDEQHGGGDDAFVVKLNALGTRLEYSTFLGGSQTDRGNDIVVDGDGLAYVAGCTFGDDFPTTPGVWDSTGDEACGDAFIAKIDSAGDRLVYSTRLGGGQDENSECIALDPSGCVYVAGETRSPDFPTTSGAVHRIPNHSSAPTNSDAFVTKLDPSGTSLVFSTYLGGSGPDGFYGIALDAAGSVFLCGQTETGAPGDRFPTTPGAFDTTHNGLSDAFFCQLDPSASQLMYATFLGGSGTDFGNDMALDQAGNAFLVGHTDSPDFPTVSQALRSVPRGLKDVFVIRFGAGEAPAEPVAEGGAVPLSFALFQNYPNPFNASTVIRFDIPRDIQVTLKIFDTLGREVRALVNRSLRAGAYTISWNGRDNGGNQSNSGVYFCQMEAGGFEDVVKMVMMR